MSTKYKATTSEEAYFITITTIGWVDVFTRIFPKKIELGKSKDPIDHIHQKFQKFDFESEKHIKVLEFFSNEKKFNEINENIKKARSTTNLDG